MRRNIKTTVEYLGTRYSGFQPQKGQPGRPTVQGELEKALSLILGHGVRINGAGRTDAGVHAFGQVVNFETPSKMSGERLLRSANAVLPPDIAVKAVEDVSPEFDARRSAVWREYHYYILNRPHRSVFFDPLCHFVAPPLDVEAMGKAASALLGRHDFSAFCSSEGLRQLGPDRTAERTVLEIACGPSEAIVWAGEPLEGLITLRVRAHAFLHNMVRVMAGTLLWVGRGRLGAADVVEILASKDRRRAGPTAPAKGLTLVRIHY